MFVVKKRAFYVHTRGGNAINTNFILQLRTRLLHAIHGERGAECIIILVYNISYKACKNVAVEFFFLRLSIITASFQQHFVERENKNRLR